MTELLPTFVSGDWTVTHLRTSLRASLAEDKEADAFLLFFYAITQQGWNEIRRDVLRWRSAKKGRVVIVFVGTDHALTEPEALSSLRTDGAHVYLLTNYQGIYHPKVLWLSGKNSNLVWVGSNNLTRDGLVHNVEFAVQISSAKAPKALLDWVKQVELASETLSDELLASYEGERRKFAVARSNAGTFTWTRRKEPAEKKGPACRSGDLVIEVMPQETGPDGKQMQLPKAALSFFGMTGNVGESKVLRLISKDGTNGRLLTMTVFANNSVRLSINELDYRTRPCVVVFHHLRTNEFEFEIVQRSIFPSRYRTLLQQCTMQTRAGSRRWAVAR